MSWRLVVLLALVLTVPALGQPPYVPPPVDGPIVPPPPFVEMGQPRPLPLDGCDPGRDGWSIYGDGSAPTAWLFNVDLTLLKPHVKNDLRVNLGVPAIYSYDDMPNAPLDWTVAPRLEFGYRYPNGGGAFLVGYRFLFTEGTDAFQGADLRSRFNLHVIDLAYETERLRPFTTWYVHGRIGGRIVGSFYDTRSTQGAFTQSQSNNFFGGGLMGTFDVEREFESFPGLALFANLDSSVVIGQVEQHFRTSFPVMGGTFSESVEQKSSQAVQSFQVQLGLSYSPATWQNLRVRAAYQFENWFDLGQLRQSNLSMNGHGAILRVELAY